jgi:hypothetical protein
MTSFLSQHADSIHGTLTGFDRIRFRGTLRAICYDKGFAIFLNILDILLTFFRSFVQRTSQRLKQDTQQLAKSTPSGEVHYLAGATDKEAFVQDLLAKHQVPDSQTGLLAVLSCVENCRSFEIHKNADTRRLEVAVAWRKCLHYYLYIRDPQFGWLHIRIMSWFPLQVQICLNGREWLARMLDDARIAYQRCDNSFVWIEDFARAQELLDTQLQTDWAKMLSELLQRYHPAFAELRNELQLRDYYWSSEQTEVATDVSFQSAEKLQEIYPLCVRYATESLHSEDVMRFLQQRLNQDGTIHGRFQGEVISDTKRRVEGVRVKHRLGANSVKMYDKFGVILRVETTIHNAEGLKVYRSRESDPEGKKAWLPLRRGVADLHRRFELSRKANEAYLEALSVVKCSETLRELVEPVSRSIHEKGRRYRGLNVWSEGDRKLLEMINDGKYMMRGFRNAELREGLYGKARTKSEGRKQSGQVTRSLQLLRAHGLIQRVPKSHRYKITEEGRKLASAVLAAERSTLEKLHQIT